MEGAHWALGFTDEDTGAAREVGSTYFRAIGCGPDPETDGREAAQTAVSTPPLSVWEVLNEARKLLAETCRASRPDKHTFMMLCKVGLKLRTPTLLGAHGGEH